MSDFAMSGYMFVPLLTHVILYDQRCCPYCTKALLSHPVDIFKIAKPYHNLYLRLQNLIIILTIIVRIQ